MNTLTEITPLILAGEGYQLTVSPEALDRKEEMLCHSTSVQHVTNNDESADAQWVTRKLAALRIEVEKSRKLVKEPVNKIGKMIDATAAEFLAEIVSEETRIKNLIGAHANEVLRIQAEKEAAERAAFEAARAAREAAEQGGIAAVIAAKQAAVAKLAASEEVAATKIAEGVRFAWDFDVDDIAAVYRAEPDLVSVEIKRSAVLSWIRELEAADEDVAARLALASIAAFKKPIVSSR